MDFWDVSDITNGSENMGCKKCAEGHGCGCGTKKADTATVEEPDWIPDGDGRAIGQQDFAINLSPLHAESKFDELSDEIAEDYEDEGKSPEEAERIGDATAAKIGYARHGKREMMRRAKAGRRKKADMVGSPSPTFDEGITGQDGPSDSPTNATFEARHRYGPRYEDMESARKRILARNIGDIEMDRYLYSQVPSKTTGEPADKYYYVALTERDGKYYVVALYGGSNRTENFVNVIGGKDSPNFSVGDFTLAKKGRGNAKEKRKSFDGIIDYRKGRGYKVYMPDKEKNMVELFGAEIYGADETLAEIEGPTAEATSGGLHAPSSFAMTWEDGAGYSSASIPPNEIAWAEGKSTSWMTWACGIALVLAGGALLKAKSGEQKAADNLRSGVNKRKGCCGGAKRFNARSMGDPAQSEDRESCVANGCEWMEADPMTRSPSYCKCGDATAKQGGLQNQLDGGVTFQSEFSVGQINPVEVEGQNDVYGAESFSSPQMSQPHWGPQTTYRQNSRRNLKMW